jgi:alanyl-tRNA synthetase
MLHIGRMTSGAVLVNADVTATVDAERRQAIRRAHSATHVLHHALHIHLGKHAQQAGSKVEPDRLRFDFSNPEAVGRERLKAIEQTVNERVLIGESISWSTMPIAEARTLGAMALFGEKYTENVRVVRMGEFSRELCGGTHLDNVGQIGLVRIVSEESVSAGTRRISALTGKAALDYVRQQEEALGEVANALKAPIGQISSRVATLLDEVKTLKKTLSQRRAESAPETSADDLLARAVSIGDVKVVAAEMGSASIDEMKQRIDVLRRKADGPLAVLLIANVDGKVNLVAGLTHNAPGKLHAGKWINEVAAVVGGRGGGRPDMAQAGGTDPSKISDALKTAVESLKAKM